MKSWLQKYYPLLIILATAAMLRINLLFVRGSFWFDEIFSFHYAQLPWHEALKYWWLETNPPLHTFLLRFWIQLVGDHELLIRLSSLILALATIILLYIWAEKLFSRQAAIISTSLLSLSGIHLFISTEARSYSLLIFLSLLSIIYYYKLINQTNIKNKNLIIFGAIQTLLLYTHLTALSLILAELIHLIITQNKKIVKKIIIPNIGAGLLFALWFIPTALAKLNSATFSGWFFNYDTRDTNLLTIIVTLLINANITALIFTLMALIIISLLILAFYKVPKEQKNLLALLTLWLFLPIISGSLLGVYITKYFVFTLPALCLLLAWGLNKITNKKILWAIFLLILSLILSSTLVVANNLIFSWPPMVKKISIQETTNSAIIVVPFNEELTIKRYYHGHNPIYGFYPAKDNLSLDERIVRYNWQTLHPSDTDFNEWLMNHTKDKDKIFFFQYSPEPSQTTKWLVSHGWQLQSQERAPGHLNINLFIFNAPNYSTTTPTSTKK